MSLWDDIKSLGNEAKAPLTGMGSRRATRNKIA